MNTKEQFRANMSFEPDVPVLKWEFGYWADTVRRWYRDGLPCEKGIPEGFEGGRSVRAEKMGVQVDEVMDSDVHNYFHLDEPQYRLPVNNFLYPLFEKQILEEHDDWVVYRDGWGVTKMEGKNRSTLEKLISGPVQTLADWEALKERLQPDLTGRLPANWKELCASYKENDCIVVLGGRHGFFGTPRYLFGDTQVLYAFHDEPELIHRINSDLCDFWIELYSRVMQDIQPDVGFIWEDMCYKNGPLISPKMFAEFMLPYYKKLCGFFRDNGVEFIHVDTDGDARKLIPLFLEGGVTGLFPMEVAAGMDVAALREAFPTLQMMGGVDKRLLMQDQATIDAHLERTIFPTLRKGGFIPTVDHLVPPDVSWENFAYYRTKLNREIDG